MSKDMTPVAGRIRWRRFAVAAVPAVAAAAGIVMLEGQGALAASFHVSGIPATISADEMVGDGFGQYGYFDAANANPQANIPGMIPVAVTGIQKATIYNLCQSVTIPGFNVSLVIKAGTDTKNPVVAKDLFIDMAHMTGNAEFSKIEIGNDASELSKGPAGLQGPQNMFGQQADHVDIKNLSQTAYATSAGTFTLNGMSLDIQWGTKTCPQ